MLIDKPPLEVANGVWMLGTTAYPMYLVRGRDEGALIEGGIGGLGPLLRRQLTDLGIGPTFVRQAVVMHAHPDHVMAIPLLREVFPGVVVTASAPAAATLGIEKAVGYFTRIDADLTQGLSQAGVLADSPPPVVVAENRIAIDRTVREGDVIAVEDQQWTVLETPGHSDCSISLHETARRVLVISDASGYYLPAQGTWWPGYYTGYGQYIGSLERLAALTRRRSASAITVSSAARTTSVPISPARSPPPASTTSGSSPRRKPVNRSGRSPSNSARRSIAKSPSCRWISFRRTAE